MPREYAKMRDRFKRKGKTTARAKEKAARIYNRDNPKHPVTGRGTAKS